jgi:hypothetical protein
MFASGTSTVSLLLALDGTINGKRKRMFFESEQQ